MNTVNQILKEKGQSVWTVEKNATVFEAMSIMADKHVGSLVVYDQGKLAGIISERDYARKVALKGKASRELPVSEVMSSPVTCVTATKTVKQCMAIMTDKHIRHLPVVTDGGELMGVISNRDLVQSIIAEQKFEIEQLEHYISG
jgi:CBS domain-containing protein